MKKKIIPVKVSWQISPSSPEMSVVEADDDGNVLIDFLATNLEGEFVERTVEISFSGCAYFMYSPCYSDLKLFDESFFDMSLIDMWLPPKGSSQAFFDKWKRTTFCPNSNFLEIEGSDEAKKVHWFDDIKHYILFGNHMMISLLARDYTWNIKH
ncbi:hypothetical protein [Aliikangiella maris]|uniref:Uncharacterized protein n=2 Tax=Aliikangiella maris TaxID=3162458 RepID=A0ABV3MKQ9_9GAMM